MKELIDHNIIEKYEFKHIGYENKKILDRNQKNIETIYQTWIYLQNEKQLNSYTTDAIKEIIIALKKASNDRNCSVVVVTARGNRSFCTGGNTEEYATYYAGRPLEYLQYMRLFNDMVTSMLVCDKPVICRVNGMRIGGGQEIGMACDFSVSGDHATFGQAGPIHGSAPDGGSTDFLHLYAGYSKAAESLVFCEKWSAHKALRLGILNEVVPVFKTQENEFIPNPLVITSEYVSKAGQIVYGEYKEGIDKKEAEKQIGNCEIDLVNLDNKINEIATKLTYTFPDCTRKSLEGLRKKKLEHWNKNSETNRSWLALNMNTEAYAGFKAFHYGSKGNREIDFVKLREAYAAGEKFSYELIEKIQPKKT